MTDCWREQTLSEQRRDVNENMRQVITFHIHPGSRKNTERGARPPNLKDDPQVFTSSMKTPSPKTVVLYIWVVTTWGGHISDNYISDFYIMI